MIRRSPWSNTKPICWGVGLILILLSQSIPTEQQLQDVMYILFIWSQTIDFHRCPCGSWKVKSMSPSNPLQCQSHTGYLGWWILHRLTNAFASGLCLFRSSNSQQAAAFSSPSGLGPIWDNINLLWCPRLLPGTRQSVNKRLLIEWIGG